MAGSTAPCVAHALFTPNLEEVASVLQKGLASHFADVSVAVVDCPDLSQKPYYLAKKGLNGSQKVVDIGGPPYLLPLVRRDKLYNVEAIAKQVETTKGLIVGAGAGPWPLIGTNSELIVNVGLGDAVDIQTRIAKMSADGKGVQQLLTTTDFALMANLYMSDGLQGKVLEVKAGKRTGSQNYMSCIREILGDHYGDKPVALGGTFLIEEGKAKLHVMSDFSACPLNTNEDVNEWLNFFEYEAPLVAVGYLVSCDPGWDLRVEHFHCFSDHGVAGHYHYDTTPDEIRYHGYFGLADTLYRVDAPTVTHQIGRD